MISFGLTVSVIGMGTVLLALLVLMGVIRVLGHFTALAGEAPPLEKRKRRKSPVTSVVASREPAGDKVEMDEETAVVIAAALTAYLRES
ncbi:MAG TPA: OadG family protein [Syntrophales bacterium]|nr:OadG family protein [Syntrophales bacterium]HQB29392.1 OadG family protein [Syntrophales bacterium]HQN77106.1 OadG family protein [Syntrophales bacterium]HQQ26125.1 OadG family protein [Syntrophales bacterium]